MDFPADTFDVLICNYMFDLLPEGDFQTVLEEFKRVLRPGGRLVVVNMTKGEHWYNNWGEAIYRINPAWFGGCRGVLLLPSLEAAGFVNTASARRSIRSTKAASAMSPKRWWCP